MARAESVDGTNGVKKAGQLDEVSPDIALYRMDDWCNTTTPWLPFLEWHEYISLVEVGSTTLAMPSSPFLSLFLAKNCGRRWCGQERGYEETEWKADRRYEGRIRSVRYVSPRGNEVKEEQRCAARSDVLVYEARVAEAGEGELVERWEVREQRGYVKASTMVRWRGGPFSSVKRCRERFETWCRWAHERSYSDAVATMLTDSLFGVDVPTSKRMGAAVVAYTPPVPPKRVNAAMPIVEPPLLEGEMTTVEKLPFVKAATLVTGDGQFTSIDQPEDEDVYSLRNESLDPNAVSKNDIDDAPFGPVDEQVSSLGANSPPWHTLSKHESARVAAVTTDDIFGSLKRRSPGATYEIEFSAAVPGLLQFAPVPKSGVAVVEGRDTRTLLRCSNAPPPSIGAALVSVNGVRVNGLSFAATMGLLNAAPPPVLVGFVEASPEALADSLGFLGQADDAIYRCKESELDAALLATPKLRDQLDDFVSSFNKCDLNALHEAADRSKRPGAMFWSAVDFATRFLQEKQILPMSMDFSPGTRRKRISLLAGSALGAKSRDDDDAARLKYWHDVRRHLEKRVMSRVYERAIKCASAQEDSELAAHLARLRFLKLADLGVVVKQHYQDNTPVATSPQYQQPPTEEEARPEWAVAQLELAQVGEAKTATEALERLASSVRFVASAVEASSNRGKPLAAYSAIGADELLPAITWTVIRANPAKLASTLWFVENYADEDLLRSEMGYAFANVSAAVNFAKSTLTSAMPLEGLISKAEFDKGVKTAHLSHKAVYAAKRKDARQLRLLLASGADPCGLSVDQTTTPLIAAIESGHPGSVDAALEEISAIGVSAKRLDAKIVSGERQGQTALCVAASVGQLATVCALLKLGADPDTVDATGRSAAALARQAGRSACAEVLSAGDPTIDPVTGFNPLVLACATGDGPKTRGLLLRGADPDAVCGKLGCPPLVAAAAAGSLECFLALLPRIADVDACAKSGAFAGQTALMRSVGLDAAAAAAANDGGGGGRTDISLAHKVVRGLAGLVSPGQQQQQQQLNRDRNAASKGGVRPAHADVQVYFATRLLRIGASRTKVDASGRTARRWAEKAGGDARLVAVLRNDPAREQIFMKARDGAAADVYALLEQGVDPDAACPEKGYTALIAAAYNDNVELASRLVDPPVVSLPAKLEDDDFFVKPLPQGGELRRRWRPANVNRAGRGGLTPLMYAAQRRSHALVTLLLRRGAEREARDERGRTALDHAEASRRATDGSDASLREQLRELLSVDPRKMLLVEAAARDDGAKVAALIAQGASPNECRRIHSSDGWHLELCTPLVAACAYDAKRAATALLDAPGVRVDLANPAGLTPLMYAAYRGSSTMLLSLLRAGASRARKDRLGRTALDWARYRARQDSDALRRAANARDVKVAGASVDRADKLAVPLLRWDPLKHTTQQLAAEGEVDGVVALVKQGVDVNALDRAQQHETALLAACAANQLAVLDKLLSHPAIRVDFPSSRGVTPLMQAAAVGFDDGVLRLLKAGAYRYAQTAQGRIAADYASENAHVALAALLQADPQRVSIHDLAAEGKLLLLDGLLRQESDLINAPNYLNGDTPLILASGNKRLKAVELLLRHPDIKVDQPNDRRETALMHAAKAGALDICSRLLSKGASSRLKDNMGRNATNWATMRTFCF